MVNYFCKKPLWKCSQNLVNVALGNRPAELVVKNAKLVNVCTREIMENVDVAVADGRIARVGDCDDCIGKNTTVIDAGGKYLAPAFFDGHIHVESSMLSVGEYAKAVIAHGTAGIFADPHEICNVLGLDGMRYMLQDAKRTPLKTMITTPSCVPAVPGFEDTGGEIGPKEIAETMRWKECVGLGEMMNFPGVLSADKRTHDIVNATLKAGKTATGHYPVPETGSGLNAYISAGICCCHESTTELEALAKMRLGMYAMFREGSAWRDLKEVAKAVTRHEVDSRFACLVSDDVHPSTLKNYGHIDRILRLAVQEGIDPVTAIQMVTINTATCFGLDHELGSIAPSKCADMVLLDDLKDFAVNTVIIDGDIAYRNGELVAKIGEYTYPDKARNSVHLQPIDKSALKISAQGTKADVRVIEIIPAKTITVERKATLPIVNGQVVGDTSQDVLKAVVFERHKNTGTTGFGFVKGFGIKHGALAQTVAHDAHNLFVIGTNDEDMVIAVNTLIACGGGAVAVQDGKILGKVELPIAGLMSDKSLAETASAVEGLERAWKQVGCLHPSPFMTMAIISLACIPELRLTNRGLVDSTKFQFVDLITKIYQ